MIGSTQKFYFHQDLVRHLYLERVDNEKRDLDDKNLYRNDSFSRKKSIYQDAKIYRVLSKCLQGTTLNKYEFLDFR
jgi:hypothetical protein